ncbi:MAG: OmpA family protein, partial [Clostridia bacterium]|nr:OmpA family protein [Clostridia bacterium]
MKKLLCAVLSVCMLLTFVGCDKKEVAVENEVEVAPEGSAADVEVEDFEENFSDNLSEEELAKASHLSAEQKKIILEKKKNLLKKLALGFKTSRLDIEIDDKSGEVIMDSSILFGNDETEVSESGKAFLRKFSRAYASVICDEEYKGFISKIVVEGHTDTNGSYDYNMQLSQKRAENVKAVCLADDVGHNARIKNILDSKLHAVG